MAVKRSRASSSCSRATASGSTSWGSTFISKTGVTSSTFKTVPDVPVGTFELYLPEGPYSALAATGNLCATSKTVTVKRRVTRRVHGRTVQRLVTT